MKTHLPIEIERFKAIRKKQRMTQAEFAKTLGIKNSTADIERGKTKISGQVVKELLLQFRINPLWLYGESSQEFLEKNSVSTMPKVITVNASDSENVLMVNQKAAAGYPHNIQDAEWHKQLPTFDIPLPEFRNATYRGFQIEGDSMLPNFLPGDWVLAKAVESLTDIKNNKIYVIVLPDSVLIKKVEKSAKNLDFMLISLNEIYAPIPIKANEIQELWQVNSRLTFSVNDASENTILKELQESMVALKKQIAQFKP